LEGNSGDQELSEVLNKAAKAQQVVDVAPNKATESKKYF
jgi:hypothetical protein